MNSVSDYSALPDASLNEGKIFTTLANYTDGAGKKFHRGRYVAKMGEWVPALMQGDEALERVEDVAFRVSTLEGEIVEKCDTEHTHVVADITDFIVETEAIAEAMIDAVRGANSGVASLDAAGKVPAAQLPSYVDDVLEYANYAALPATGETGKIYVLATPYTASGVTSAQFRWSGSAYVAIIASPGSTDSVTEGTTNLYFTTARVLATVLTGLSTATNAVVSATDGVLTAIGKLQAQCSSFASRLSALEAWRTATGIKRCERHLLTANSSGEINVTFDTAIANVNKVAIIVNGVYNGTDHPVEFSIRSWSTTGSGVKAYRAVTLALLGSTVTHVANQSVNVTVIEFD